MRARTVIAALMLALSVGPAHAQRPVGREEVVTKVPELDGVKALVPIPSEFHVRNEGGSDGAGLCVIASNLSDGWFQGVQDFDRAKDSPLWRLAKGKPGGYYPEKLKNLFDEAGVTVDWLSAEGTAAELVPVIKHYLRQGIPVATTMSYSQRYGMRIHHMIQTVHLDDDLACIVDNNFPGTYLWVTADEYERRLLDGRAGWAVVLLWGARGLAWAAIGAVAACILGGLMLSAASVVLVAVAREA